MTYSTNSTEESLRLLYIVDRKTGTEYPCNTSDEEIEAIVTISEIGSGEIDRFEYVERRVPVSELDPEYVELIKSLDE